MTPLFCKSSVSHLPAWKALGGVKCNSRHGGTKPMAPEFTISYLSNSVSKHKITSTQYQLEATTFTPLLFSILFLLHLQSSAIPSALLPYVSGTILFFEHWGSVSFITHHHRGISTSSSPLQAEMCWSAKSSTWSKMVLNHAVAMAGVRDSLDCWCMLSLCSHS